VRGRKNEVVGLQMAASSRLTCGQSCSAINDGDGACIAESVGDERVLASRDERLVPNNEENTLCVRRREAFLQSRKLMFHFSRQRMCQPPEHRKDRRASSRKR